VGACLFRGRGEVNNWGGRGKFCLSKERRKGRTWAHVTKVLEGSQSLPMEKKTALNTPKNRKG